MIHEHLFRGKENARTSRELARLIGCNTRTITAGVSRERQAGWPICSTSMGANPGYYLAANEEEKERCYRSLANRAGEIYAAAKGLKNSSLEGVKEEKPKQKQLSMNIVRKSHAAG